MNGGEPLRIALLGDIGLFRRNSIECNEAIQQRFASVASILREFDIVIGNLETPLTDARHPMGGKSAYLRSPKENVAILQLLGVRYVCLSNNHLFDYGIKGFADTILTLERASIGYFGVDGKAHYLDEYDGRLELHGFCCYSTNPVGMMDAKSGRGIHPYAPRELVHLLQSDQTKGYLSILSIHAGEEHVHYPNPDHLRWARRLAKVAPYVYYGHHPHVLQGIECIRESLIAYSLGNFCFDDVYTSKSREPLVQLTAANSKTCILALEVMSNELVDWKIIPIRDDGQRLLVDDSITDELAQWSQALTDDEILYRQRRDSLLRERYNSRKKQRNMAWYLKRLTPESAAALLRSRRCNARYRVLVGDQPYES